MRAELLPFWATLAAVGALLGTMFLQSFAGGAPADVEVGPDGRVRITMRGAMPVFALRRRIDLDPADIETVHADPFARNLLGGFRVGTSFPGVMTAGWYYRGGGRGWDFFAVYRAKSALVLDLVPGRRRFRRVIVEVEDLAATAAALQGRLAPA